jgi:hypothetical protein
MRPALSGAFELSSSDALPCVFCLAAAKQLRRTPCRSHESGRPLPMINPRRMRNGPLAISG